MGRSAWKPSTAGPENTSGFLVPGPPLGCKCCLSFREWLVIKTGDKYELRDGGFFLPSGPGIFLPKRETQLQDVWHQEIKQPASFIGAGEQRLDHTWSVESL